ncbi:MAG: FMN-binding negative transcriptional regulator [Planctomycetaceae bacterium]|nr:FMN-binding negative transcriptional regulator [Planctomycetaceae bacterium]
MYTPRSFVEERPERLHDFIEHNSFGILVTAGNGIVASHLPFLLDRDSGPHGQLTSHMAKANPQWRELDSCEVLTIFHGPHAYISPTWYQAGNTVPTWNYVAVHATGTLRVTEAPEQLRDIVRCSVDTHEAHMPTPWSMDSVDDAFIDQLLKSIVGFTIEITRLEGKWKLNQNHNVERRERVIDALQIRGSDTECEIARLMQERLDK